MDEIKAAPLLDDQPSPVDLLNYRQYSVALRNVVLAPQTSTPLTIGIFGRWGTGKTTLMKMIERNLDPKLAVTIWFNAWVYGKEQEIWAAFLQAITLQLQEKLAIREKVGLSRRLFQ